MGQFLRAWRGRIVARIPRHWRARGQAWLLRRLHFVEAPPLRLDAGKVRAFEELYQTMMDSAPGEILDYRLPYPKHEFLRYLVARKHLLIHGSNHPAIVALAPNWDK